MTIVALRERVENEKWLRDSDFFRLCTLFSDKWQRPYRRQKDLIFPTHPPALLSLSFIRNKVSRLGVVLRYLISPVYDYIALAVFGTRIAVREIEKLEARLVLRWSEATPGTEAVASRDTGNRMKAKADEGKEGIARFRFIRSRGTTHGKALV